MSSALSASSAIPAIDQCRQLDIAADEARELPRRDREAAPHAGGLAHGICAHWHGDAFERQAAEILQQEHARHEPLGDAAHDQQVGRGRGREARGDVRGVADGEDLAAGAATHDPDHHRTRVDADAGGQADPVLGLERVVERSEGGEDLEPGHG